MQGIWGSSPAEGNASWDFSSCGRNLGYIIEIQQRWPFQTPLCQRSQDTCQVRKHTSGILTRFGRIIQTLLEVRWETSVPF